MDALIDFTALFMFTCTWDLKFACPVMVELEWPSTLILFLKLIGCLFHP